MHYFSLTQEFFTKFRTLPKNSENHGCSQKFPSGRRTADAGAGRQTAGRQSNAFAAVNLKSSRNDFFKWQMEKAALYLRISHIKTGKIHDRKAD